ncbi:hypothetical protein SEPCBS119000_006224 [Sporothrix epigloea]|uniref:Major facilitator superfamily (MFS) profile domain-containing protein n=1 Tax=Sporothrix epigloea TaxID=1892477 RepID=A0ABP0E1U7_9PEZI
MENVAGTEKTPVKNELSEPQPAIHVEWLADAQDANSDEHKLGFWTALRVYRKSVLWSVAVSTAIFMDGYDTMMMGNLYGQPAFRERYGFLVKKDNYQIPAPWQIGLNNGSSCGQLIGLLLSGYACDRFGFRKTMALGLSGSIPLIFILFFAPNLPVLEVGQILFGIPLGLFQTLPVVYAAEIAPGSLKPYLTTYVNSCWAIGHLIGAGIFRGCLPMTSQWAYRIPFAIQWIWPTILLPVLWFAPESPWWLVRRGRLEDAKVVLRGLTAKGEVALDVDKSVALMAVTVDYERTVNSQTSYSACFKGVDLRRTVVVITIYCIQTLSGNPLRSSSTYFMEQAGFPSTQAANLTVINYALALIGGFAAWVLLPLFGRRPIYVWSLGAMFILLVLIGGLGIPQAHSTNTSYSWAIGALLIISSFLYNATMGPLTNTLCAEIPSALLRSKSVVLARWVYTVTSIIAGVFSPYQLNPSAWNWGAKTGFFWAGACLMSFIFAFFCVPETKDRSSAEMDILFDRKLSARHFHKTTIDLTEAVIEKTDGEK